MKGNIKKECNRHYFGLYVGAVNRRKIRYKNFSKYTPQTVDKDKAMGYNY